MNERDCRLCRIIAGEVPGQIVDEDERTLGLMAIEPATRGHVIVAPRRHAADLFAVGDEDLAATVAAAKRVATSVVDRLGADGVNLINSCGRSAGQTVFHFHIHVIPRYAGDPLRLVWRSAASGPDDISAVAAALR